jgi:hypothetical protein
MVNGECQRMLGAPAIIAYWVGGGILPNIHSEALACHLRAHGSMSLSCMRLVGGASPNTIPPAIPPAATNGTQVLFHLLSPAPRPSTHTTQSVLAAFPEANGSRPPFRYRLLDPSAAVELPPPGAVRLAPSDNRELDKLVAALGRSKATWRRALMLHEWLLHVGHRPDDRLCTTLIRVCAQHSHALAALSIYDWMRTPVAGGGGGLQCTVYTYTAAMRAALAGCLLDRAVEVRRGRGGWGGVGWRLQQSLLRAHGYGNLAF